VNKVKIWFSDFWRPSTLQYIKRNALYKMLSKYYELELTKDKPDFLLYSCFGYDYLKYNCIRIFYAGENVRPNFDECDYAFSFDYPITERNFRLPLYRLSSAYEKLFEPRNPEKVISEERKFCCFLASNPDAKERNDFFHLLSTYKKVDAGGKVFFNLDQPVPRGKEIEWMSNYKFCLAFENSSYPGYTTEKLLNALIANTIPVYWGNPLVEKDFNNKAFINCHSYQDFNEAIKIVKEVDIDNYRYQSFLREPYLNGGIEIEECKEAVIIERFSQIFSKNLHQVSKTIKKIQKLKYPLLIVKNIVLKKVIKDS